MMDFAFPSNIRVLQVRPTLEGMRFEPFTNVDGESFAKPSLGGFWRVEMTVAALTERARLSLSAYITAMAGNARSLVPICPMSRPYARDGMLAGAPPSPDYPTDHTGFASQPYAGLTLRSAAFHRDSYIEVDHPDDLQIWAGHFVSLGDRLHQIVLASALDDRTDRSRLTLRPLVRGNYPLGEVVIIDQLRLRCAMLEGGQIGFEAGKHRQTQLTFVEAF